MTSVKVNPPPFLKLPRAFLVDREIRAFIEQQNNIIFQLYNRTGGNVDLLGEFDERITANKELIALLALRVEALEYRAYTTKKITEPTTTEPFTTYICENTAEINVTLDTDAKLNDEVNIKRMGGNGQCDWHN